MNDETLAIIYNRIDYYRFILEDGLTLAILFEGMKENNMAVEHLNDAINAEEVINELELFLKNRKK